MSAHGAAGFAQQSSSLGSLTADIAGFASSVPSPRLATPPLLSSPPALPGLRGGMQDVDDWGRPDVHHHYDLSTLIADRPAQQVLCVYMHVHVRVRACVCVCVCVY